MHVHQELGVYTWTKERGSAARRTPSKPLTERPIRVGVGFQ
jgi:hypothetical protein